jgi:hypothetical protein
MAIHLETKNNQSLPVDESGYTGAFDGTQFSITHDPDGVYHVKAQMGEGLMQVVMKPGTKYAITSGKGNIIEIGCE